MKTFAQLREETSSYEMHKKRVQKIPKGSEVSFTHSTSGKNVTGTYKGLKQMGGRSYAHVEHGDGATYVPVHQIHESVDEAVDHKERVKKIPKGSEVSFTHSTSGKKVTGTFKGIKQMSGRPYAHVEHKDGATYVPVHQIHESAQLDEISVKKMKDYQDKASADAAKAVDDAENAGSSRKAEPHYRRAAKREQGIDRADRLITKMATEAAEEVPEHKWSNIASHRGLHQFYTSLNKKGDGWITQHNKGKTTHHKTYQDVTDHIKKFVGPKESHIHTTDDRDPRAEKIFDRDDEGWKKHPLLKMKS